MRPPRLPALPRVTQNLSPPTYRWAHDLLRTLESWASQLDAQARSLVLRDVLFRETPNGILTTFTVPYSISRDEDGTPFASVVSGTKCFTWNASNPPPVDHWALVETPNGQQIVFNPAQAPAANDAPHCSFLVTR